MAITWTIDNEGRADLGQSGILQAVVGTFGASDYVTGGYPIYAKDVGMSSIRGIIPSGFSSFGAGNPGGYVWEAQSPSTPGPANTYPWYLRALEQSAATGPLVEPSASTSFAGGTIRLLVNGY